MAILKPFLLLAALVPALLCHDARATDPPPRVGAERMHPKAQAAPAARAKAAPAKKAGKRRAVAAQLDDGLNPPTYAPRLETAPAPVRRIPGLDPAPPETPPGPVILNGCQGAAHCMDSNGNRYNPVGTSLISPSGRLCSNNGISVSCY